MSEEVAERIRRRIRERGPITFAEFMDEALYGPGGFYERPPVGPKGDFVTSPHVHPVFSRLVGVALEEMWTALGRPAPYRLVEVGAGDGTLARELLDGFGRGGIDVEYSAVEVGAGAREALAAVTPNVAARLTDLPPLDPGVVFANELLDDLPFRRIRRRGDAVVEIRIGLDGDRFAEVETAFDGERQPESALDGGPGPDELEPLWNADEAVVPTGAFDFVDELGRSLARGYGLLIDYGSAEGPAGQVHGYRGHRLLEDVLDDPGSADVTAGVDFAAVARRAREAGLASFETVSQQAALVALGYEEWMRAELEHQGELLNAGRGLESVRTWGGRGRARLLVDPAGLGRFRWLVLATPGLPEPGWLPEARSRPRTD
jgi:NADH dehydrogenase [ubiquinone] 1 alpha subcomplex assembly factor 7